MNFDLSARVPAPSSELLSETPWVRLVRFHYAPGDLLLRVALRVAPTLPERAPRLLVVEQGGVREAMWPLVWSSARAQPAGPEEWLCRGAFPLPPEIAFDPLAGLAIQFAAEGMLELPRLGGPTEPARLPTPGLQVARSWPYAIRKGALALFVSCQLCLVPSVSSGALADGGPAISSASAPAPEVVPAPVQEATSAVGTEAPAGGEQPQQTPPVPGVPVTTEPPPTPEQPPEPAPVLPSPPNAGTGTQNSPGKPAAPPLAEAGSATSSATETSSSEQPAASVSSVKPSADHAPSSSQPGVPAPRRQALPPKSSRPHAQHHPKPPAQAKPAPSVDPAAQGPAVTTEPNDQELAENPFALGGLPASLTQFAEETPPPYLVPIYMQAGRRYHVPWTVLAAINRIETDYGLNLSTSSAGAVGWMQFMPETWSRWGVDADHDGTANPYSPRDAIFTAARYLQASGAAVDLPGAIFAYNHAGWYVAEVLLRARELAGSGDILARVERGYALPLDARYMKQLGRTDDGVDIETAPDGALVYSMTPGIVSAVASDPGGFGPNYPVIEASAGSLAGQYIYYGHVAEALVRPGQRVAAGQPIAIMGHTGDAVSLGHGHIEIGFSDAGGDPLSHHGSVAWTPAGEVMRGFLVGLSSSFHISND